MAILNVTMVGDKALLAKYNGADKAVIRALQRKISILSTDLLTLVKLKLSGMVLHVRTGLLRDSAFKEISNNGLTAKVAEPETVPYAAIHEFGGVTKPHDIFPSKAKVLAFAMGGKQRFFAHVHHPGSVIPERSYLRSSLDDMKDTIKTELEQAVRGVFNAPA